MTDQPTTPDQPAPPSVDPATPPAAPATQAVDPSGALPVPPPPTPAAPEGKDRSKVMKIVVGLAVAAAIIALKFGVFNVLFADKPAADRLSVGQCVKPEASDTADTGILEVACTDATAEYKILHIEKDTADKSGTDVCAKFPDTENVFSEYQEGETKGNVICLGAAK